MPSETDWPYLAALLMDLKTMCDLLGRVLTLFRIQLAFEPLVHALSLPHSYHAIVFGFAILTLSLSCVGTCLGWAIPIRRLTVLHHIYVC